MNNPFRYSTVVNNELFADREQELETLLNLTKLGENVVVSAPAGLGKSSLLAEFARRNFRDYLFINIDLASVTDEGSFVDGFTREAMRSGFGVMESFPPTAWQLLTSPRLRRAVFDTSDLRLQRVRLRKQPKQSSTKASKEDIRICSSCGKPLKWVEKYKMHYCYSCRKYAPIRRRLKAPTRTDESARAEESICPRCGSQLRFNQRYSEFWCEKCRRYPLLPLSKKGAERPTLADLIDVLDLPEKIALEKAIRVVVMLDEFHRLDSIVDSSVLLTMRRRFEMHGNVNYIFTGSSTSALSRLFEERNAPFRDFANWMTLRPMPPEALGRFLVDRFRKAKGKLSEEAAAMIADLSGGYPQHAQKIAHELFHISSAPTLSSLEDAVSTVVRHNTPTYNVLWESIRSPLHRKYLMALAVEPRVAHGADFVRRHDLRSRSHVQRIERQLETRGIIEEGEIVDPMFVIWLRSPVKT